MSQEEGLNFFKKKPNMLHNLESAAIILFSQLCSACAWFISVRALVQETWNEPSTAAMQSEFHSPPKCDCLISPFLCIVNVSFFQGGNPPPTTPQYIQGGIYRSETLAPYQ